MNPKCRNRRLRKNLAGALARARNAAHHAALLAIVLIAEIAEIAGSGASVGIEAIATQVADLKAPDAAAPGAVGSLAARSAPSAWKRRNGLTTKMPGNCGVLLRTAGKSSRVE